MERNFPLIEKLVQINWKLVVLLTIVACFGFVMQYSAAEGHMLPWAGKQIIRYIFFLPVMLFIAVTPIKYWIKIAYPVYFIVLSMLIYVDSFGVTAMGATRWISIGPFALQPSEPMKICVVLALARFFHSTNFDDVDRPLFMLIPALIVFVPAGLVYLQPDLGTALIIIAIGGLMMFMAGIAMWKFIAIALAGVAAIPVVWEFMHDYQRERVFQFLDPARDPLGSGYNITQSKIAIGSGGFSGKGLLQGTQSQLSFLPEKQTDFIFTMLTEEFGFIGGVILLSLYAAIIITGFRIASTSRNHYGRMVAIGVTIILFLHVFINVAMVMGLIPVVGAPLPLLSYGGTIMITMMIGFGFVLNADLHRDELLDHNISDIR